MARIVMVVVLFVGLFSSPCYGLPDNYKKTLERHYNIVRYSKTAYVWCAAGSEKDGVLQLDCSGLLYWLYKKSGIPVKRSTAFRMKHGLEGWIGKDIHLNDVEAHDILFWTWKGQENTRPFGHVGLVYEDPNSGLLEAMHSSSSKNGVTVQQLRGSLLRDLKAVRRITIGDKK